MSEAHLMLHVLSFMQVLRRLQLHVELLAEGLHLLHVVVVNGYGLLRHGGLGHLVHLHTVIVMLHPVVHLHMTNQGLAMCSRSVVADHAPPASPR